MSRRRLPFGLHQAAELLIGILLIVVGLHVTSPSLYFLVAGGSLLVLMVVLTEGPLSAWELLGRKGHSRADWVAIAALAVMPAVPGRTLLSALLLEFSAVALWRLTTWTRFEPKPPGRRRFALAGHQPAPRASTPTGLAPEVDLAVRRTVRKAGIAAGVVRRRRMRS